jgi:AAA15 family ATPase/GTPase
MIIRFAIENYKSFKDREELLLAAGTYKRLREHVYVSNDGLGLLRSTAIYGGNGAGKTNFISAIQYLKDIVVSGIVSTKEISFKLCKNHLKKPTIFEIEYLHDNIKYYYVISILDNIIKEESLYEITGEGSKKNIFTRKYDEKNGETDLMFSSFEDVDTLQRERVKVFKDIVAKQPTMTFFNLGATLGIESLKHPFEWFTTKLKTIGFNHNRNDLPYVLYKNNDFLKMANQILPSTNVGILKIDLRTWDIFEFFSEEEKPRIKSIIRDLEYLDYISVNRNNINYNVFKNGTDKYIVAKVVAIHEDVDGDSIPFDLTEESDGTQKLLCIIPALIDTLMKESVYIIDEIESSLHPVLLKELIESYLNMGENYKGQLIFSTHESVLMDLKLFRQDEIWLTEKDYYGASKIYSLAEFNVRFDKSIRKDYLKGKYGDIPFIPKQNLLKPIKIYEY